MSLSRWRNTQHAYPRAPRRGRIAFSLVLLLVGGALLAAEWRRANAAETSVTPALPTLTSIDQILAQGRVDNPTIAHPVRVQGVITHVKGWLGRWITIHDGTNGCAINGTGLSADLRVGQRVEVDGELAVESHYPHIARARVAVLGEGAIPKPTLAVSSGLASGRHHGGWVKLQASVLDVCRAEGKPVYLLGSGGISFNAFVE